MIERIEVTPGPGTVIRFGGIVAWADLSASPALISFLAQSARNLGPSPRGGRQIADHIAGVLVARDPEPHVAFAVIGPSDHGWASLLHGPVQAWDGARWLAPTPVPGWLQAIITPRPAITVGAAGVPAPPVQPDSLWDLEAGVVPGAGFVLTPGRVASRATPAHPAPDEARAGEGPSTTAVPGLAPVIDPAPQIDPAPDIDSTEVAATTALAATTTVPGLAPVIDPAPQIDPAPDIDPTEVAATTALAATTTVPGLAPVIDPAPQIDPTADIDPTGVAATTALGPLLPTVAMASIEAGRVLADREPEGPLGDPVTDPETDPVTDLDTEAAPEPERIAPRPTQPGPAGSLDLRAVADPSGPPLPLGASPDQRVPGAPVVAGVLCERGHLNRPGRATCARCGAPIPPRPREQVSGTRPPLGVLITDDGAIYRLDRGYLVGSNASRDPTVGGGLARPLVLSGHDVSGSHAEVRLSDWDVTVVDRGSAAGTCVYDPGVTEWTRLRPHEPRLLAPGTHVAFGQRVVTFISPWVTTG